MFICPILFSIRAKIKAATTELHDFKGNMSKEERRLAPFPFVVAAEAAIEESVIPAKATFTSNNPDLQVIIEYAAHLDAIKDSAMRTDFIVSEWMYVRQRTTWTKKECVIEFGLSPFVSEQGKLYFRALRKLRIATECCELMGVAPMSAIERRIEQTLKQ